MDTVLIPAPPPCELLAPPTLGGCGASSLRRYPRRPRSRAGFTLIEVVMATFVMLFGIASSFIVIQSGFKALDTARKTTLAAQIMQSEMERIRMLNWTQINALPADETLNLSNIFPQNTVTEQKLYTQISKEFGDSKRKVTSLNANNNEVRQITVSVTWTGLDGIRHNRSSSTQYCKDGLYAYYYRIP